MFEMIVGFYIILIDQSRYMGGKNIQGFYKPEVEYKTEEECRENRKMIEEWFEDEAERLYPNHKGIDAKALCILKTKKGE